MNHLLRSLAPISDAAWRLLDEAARSSLVAALAARRLVDFAGPHGWDHSASNLGRTRALRAGPCEGVGARQRQALPLVELRAGVELARDELRDVDRGAKDPDLGPLEAAARRLAVAENTAVFHGFAEGSIRGIADASPYEPIVLGASAETYPREVATAVERLLREGIVGPYALALGGEQYRCVAQSAEHGGYPLWDHLRKILEGPIVYSPGVRGAVVMSTRGGDFLLDVGQDLAVGYSSHDEQAVRLYVEESFSFRVAEPKAAIALALERAEA